VVGLPVPARGQVWNYIQGSHQTRVLILSSDEYNQHDRFQPLGLLVLREGVGGPLQPRLTAGDPLPDSFVHVARPVRIVRTGLRTNLGFVGEATMMAVELGLREVYELP
jgi:hypothetical protein